MNIIAKIKSAIKTKTGNLNPGTEVKATYSTKNRSHLNLWYNNRVYLDVPEDKVDIKSIT